MGKAKGRMIIWGGVSGLPVNSGGILNLCDDTWASTPQYLWDAECPSARGRHTAQNQPAFFPQRKNLGLKEISGAEPGFPL